MIGSRSLVYHRINVDADGVICAAHHYDACLESFGTAAGYEGRIRYLAFLREKVEEFPDGCLLAYLEGRCLGHLELQVPYGLTIGYVNLFYVTPPFRGQGFGRLMHEHAERYFRSWEANRVELHVSPTNRRAVSFYKAMGYSFVQEEHRRQGRLWCMAKSL